MVIRFSLPRNMCQVREVSLMVRKAHTFYWCQGPTEVENGLNHHFGRDRLYVPGDSISMYEMSEYFDSD